MNTYSCNAGTQIAVYDAILSVGHKFLLACRGGLNLTFLSMKIVTMTTSTIVIAILIVTALLISHMLFGERIPRSFRYRACQGRAWRRAFPSTPRQEIREFLAVFTNAFVFQDKEALKFHPEDQILQIYRTLYPNEWLPDSLEVETLARGVEARYGIKLEAIWRDGLSLGELFTAVRKPAQA